MYRFFLSLFISLFFNLIPTDSFAQNTYFRDNRVFPWNVDSVAACNVSLNSGVLNGNVINVSDFGARGDGVSDNYSAFKSLAYSLDSNRLLSPTLVIFPYGNYKIDRYKIECGADAAGHCTNRIKDGSLGNKNTDIIYNNIRNVRFLGCGSTVEVRGNFIRTQDLLVNTAPDGSKFYNSYSNSIIPFRINSGQDFSIEDFILNGNVNQMQREENVSEGGGNGIMTNGCSRFTINRIKTHHFSSDGIYLGQGKGVNYVADKDVVIDSVESKNNGRQGITVLQAVNVSILNSAFLDTGKTETSLYPPHASSGIDIEPNAVPGDPEHGQIDMQTTNILIDHCLIANNLGAQISANTGANSCINGICPPSYVGKVTISNSSIYSSDLSSSNAVIISVNDGTIMNSKMFLADDQLYTFWGPARNLSKNVKTTLIGNKIYGTGNIPFLVDGADTRNHELLIKQNQIFLNQSSPAKGVYIKNNLAKFLENKIYFYPKNDFVPVSLDLLAKESRNNRYLTLTALSNYPATEVNYSTSTIRTNEVFFKGNYLIKPENNSLRSLLEPSAEELLATENSFEPIPLSPATFIFQRPVLPLPTATPTAMPTPESNPQPILVEPIATPTPIQTPITLTPPKDPNKLEAPALLFPLSELVSSKPIIRWEQTSGTNSYEVRVYSLKIKKNKTKSKQIRKYKTKSNNYQIKSALKKGNYKYKVKTCFKKKVCAESVGYFLVAS